MANGADDNERKAKHADERAPPSLSAILSHAEALRSRECLRPHPGRLEERRHPLRPTSCLRSPPPRRCTPAGAAGTAAMASRKITRTPRTGSPDSWPRPPLLLCQEGATALRFIARDQLDVPRRGGRSDRTAPVVADALPWGAIERQHAKDPFNGTAPHVEDQLKDLEFLARALRQRLLVAQGAVPTRGGNSRHPTRPRDREVAQTRAQEPSPSSPLAA
jgi:hypothetical protein